METSSPITDPPAPELFTDAFPREGFPRYDWTERPPDLPAAAWTTETTHRDGQQGGLPLTVEAGVRIYDLMCAFTGASGAVRQAEFFVYRPADRRMLEIAIERHAGGAPVEPTTWIRASRRDAELVGDLGVRETGMLASASDYHTFHKFRPGGRRQAAAVYLDAVRAVLDAGLRPRLHLEDATRAPEEFVLPFAQAVIDACAPYGRAGAPRRRGGRADDPGRLGLLVGQGDRGLSGAPDPLLDQRAPGSGHQAGDRGHPRGRLGGDRLHALRHRQVAETRYRGMRLVVRRTRHDEPQGELAPDWRHHAFVSDRADGAIALDADHRAHAVIELAIRDIKEGSGLAHCPSGHFFANSAWLVIASLAHNLVRWIARIGLGTPGAVVTATIARRLFSLPGRITRSGRRRTLHLPSAWPWAEPFTRAITRLRAVSLQI